MTGLNSGHDCLQETVPSGRIENGGCISHEEISRSGRLLNNLPSDICTIRRTDRFEFRQLTWQPILCRSGSVEVQSSPGVHFFSNASDPRPPFCVPSKQGNIITFDTATPCVSIPSSTDRPLAL